MKKRLTILTFYRFAKNWNIDDVVEGLNRIGNLIRAGERVYYDMWPEEDQAKDLRKRDTTLFHFPVTQKSPFILVYAGGAYQMVALYLEAFPVATEVNR